MGVVVKAVANEGNRESAKTGNVFFYSRFTIDVGTSLRMEHNLSLKLHLVSWCRTEDPRQRGMPWKCVLAMTSSLPAVTRLSDHQPQPLTAWHDFAGMPTSGRSCRFIERPTPPLASA
jgi:hypothetical protein